MIGRKSDVKSLLAEFKTKLNEAIVNRKDKIIQDINFEKKSMKKRCEAEGLFTKNILNKLIRNGFEEAVVEGPDSKMQFKCPFFGTRSAPDFNVKKPARIVGEVKYASLTGMNMSKAVGQVLLYIAASKKEQSQFDYGCIIFFDTSKKFKGFDREEREFVKRLWNFDNIFVIIL